MLINSISFHLFSLTLSASSNSLRCTKIFSMYYLEKLLSSPSLSSSYSLIPLSLHHDKSNHKCLYILWCHEYYWRIKNDIRANYSSFPHAYECWVTMLRDTMKYEVGMGMLQILIFAGSKTFLAVLYWMYDEMSRWRLFCKKY